MSPDDFEALERLLNALKGRICVTDSPRQVFALDRHYHGPNKRSLAGEIMYECKYGNNWIRLPRLISEFVSFIRGHPVFRIADVIVAVPPSPSKRGLRSLPVEIALGISAQTGITTQQELVRKVRDTNMKDLETEEDKVAHIRGAFSVEGSGELRDKRVIVVDDICHSGATLTEFCEMLSSEGATVVALCATKTTRNI